MGRILAMLVGIDAHQAPVNALQGCLNDGPLKVSMMAGRVAAAYFGARM